MEQCSGGELKYGGINSTDELTKNLRMNCVPESVINMEIQDYEQFLEARRKLISQKIKAYYQSL